MCGIAGFLDPSARLGSTEARARLRGMTQAIAHRGPDSDGHLTESAGTGGVWAGLGHRRLSILDLSPNGAQPMASACGRYVIAFNGEIYNYRDLRSELEAAGAGPWRGHADTEVLLALIARHGVAAALQRCDGMFALALLDRERRILTLARDAFGEKPLVYGMWDGVVLFGSELKALRAWPGFAPDEDAEALTEFFAYGCIPAPRTIHRGVFKLPPAHLLDLDATALRTGQMPNPHPWWDMVGSALAARAQPFTGDSAEAATAVGAALARSVARRMVSDVPLGALLSGGIDSSLTTALMQAASDRPVKTFTIGMDAEGYDESPQAEAVARHLGTEHRTLRLTPTEVQSAIPELAGVHDEPFADSSQLPTLLVARMARSEVAVVLSGDGGDEIFAGYNRHFVVPQMWRRLAGWPVGLRGMAGAGLGAVPPGLLTGAVRLAGPLAPRDLHAGRAGEKLHKLASLIGAPDPSALHDRLLRTGDPRAVLANRGDCPPLPARADPRTADLPLAEALMLFDTGQYMPDDVLAKVDRASMAVSLETRTPFLERELFTLAWSLPMSLKVQNRTGKAVLRDLLYRHVPKDLVDRPKAGFTMPVGRWLRGPLADWAESLLNVNALTQSSIFDVESVRRLWSQHRTGSRNHETALWAVLMYQAWRADQTVARGLPCVGN
ncbi:MAG: asparagine synthase (glutamine-hydrolyzing) [Paracoccaceae bacterium]